MYVFRGYFSLQSNVQNLFVILKDDLNLNGKKSQSPIHLFTCLKSLIGPIGYHFWIKSAKVLLKNFTSFAMQQRVADRTWEVLKEETAAIINETENMCRNIDAWKVCQKHKQICE